MVQAALLDELLPQLQCRQCGYAGCAPYAQALADAQAPINLCKPGGDTTLNALAHALGLDPTHFSVPRPDPPQWASIDPSSCIGCTRCLPACPVDAIMGARRYLHTVLQSECTGCGLCVEPCPTDCIRLVPRIAPSSPQPDDLVQGTGSGLPDRETRAQLRERYKRHQTRFPEASAVVHARLTDAARLGEIQSIVHKRRARTTGATRPPSS